MIHLLRQFIHTPTNPHIDDLQGILWYLIKNIVCHDKYNSWEPGTFIQFNNNLKFGMGEQGIAMLRLPTHELRLEEQSVVLYQLQHPYGPVSPQSETFHKILNQMFLSIPEHYLTGPHLYNKAKQFHSKIATSSNHWTYVNPANPESSWEVGVVNGTPAYRNRYYILLLTPHNRFATYHRMNGLSYRSDTPCLFDKLAESLPEFTQVPQACQAFLQELAEREKSSIRQHMWPGKNMTCQKRLSLKS